MVHGNYVPKGMTVNLCGSVLNGHYRREDKLPV